MASACPGKGTGLIITRQFPHGKLILFYSTSILLFKQTPPCQHGGNSEGDAGDAE
jgi:hypothetical protein